MRPEVEEVVINANPLQLAKIAEAFTAVAYRQKNGGYIAKDDKNPPTEEYAYLFFRAWKSTNGKTNSYSQAMGEVFASILPNNRTLARVAVSDKQDRDSVWAFWDGFMGELDRQGWLGEPLPGLSRLEQGIVDVIQEFREEGIRFTNGVISGELHSRGIYNPSTGKGYSEEHISRNRSKLKEVGYEV